MNCQKCNNPGIENQANGKPFWFCRSCRIEIDEPKSGFKWVSDWMSLDSIGATKYTPPAGYNLVTHPNGNTAYLVPMVPQGVPTPLPVSQSPAQGPIQAPISPFYRLVKKSSSAAVSYTFSPNYRNPGATICFFGPNSQIKPPIAFSLNLGAYLTVSDWLPAQDPQPGDNFCGVDRSLDPTRLAGIRVPNQFSRIDSNVSIALSLVQLEGGAPNKCFVPAGSINTIPLAYIYGKHNLISGEVGAMVKINGILIEFVEDPTLDPDTAFLLQMDTWEEIGGTLVCKSPGYNARIKLV